MDLRKLFLTFDIEDFINKDAYSAWLNVLRILNKHELPAIFFITGHVAERIVEYPEIIDLLCQHEIGYHSTSHGVRPNIFEYTDIPSYEQARRCSLVRETSSIDPISGDVLGKGGINVLNMLFPKKRIQCFRAPYNCWSPPHLEALNSLNIKYDFSTVINNSPFLFKNTIFYPTKYSCDSLIMQFKKFLKFIIHILKNINNEYAVFEFHPSIFYYAQPWDSFYFYNNTPKKLIPSVPRSNHERMSIMNRFDLFMKRIKIMQKANLIEIRERPHVRVRATNFYAKKKDVHKLYSDAINKAKEYFFYQPRYLQKHFVTYFNLNSSECVRGE